MKRRYKATNVERIASQDESALADKFQEELMAGPMGDTGEVRGKIFKSDKMLAQELEFVSDGINDGGNEYKLFLGRISRSPIVQNPRTGYFYILPWTDIIKMAEAAGLNR